MNPDSATPTGRNTPIVTYCGAEKGHASGPRTAFGGFARYHTSMCVSRPASPRQPGGLALVAHDDSPAVLRTLNRSAGDGNVHVIAPVGAAAGW